MSKPSFHTTQVPDGGFNDYPNAGPPLITPIYPTIQPITQQHGISLGPADLAMTSSSLESELDDLFANVPQSCLSSSHIHDGHITSPAIIQSSDELNESRFLFSHITQIALETHLHVFHPDVKLTHTNFALGIRPSTLHLDDEFVFNHQVMFDSVSESLVPQICPRALLQSQTTSPPSVRFASTLFTALYFFSGTSFFSKAKDPNIPIYIKQYMVLGLLLHSLIRTDQHQQPPSSQLLPTSTYKSRYFIGIERFLKYIFTTKSMTVAQQSLQKNDKDGTSQAVDINESYKHLLLLLLSGNILLASQYALSCGLPSLSSLILGVRSTAQRQILQEQIIQWKENHTWMEFGQFQQLVYHLLAGNITDIYPLILSLLIEHCPFFQSYKDITETPEDIMNSIPQALQALPAGVRLLHHHWSWIILFNLIFFHSSHQNTLNSVFIQFTTSLLSGLDIYLPHLASKQHQQQQSVNSPSNDDTDDALWSLWTDGQQSHHISLLVLSLFAQLDTYVPKEVRTAIPAVPSAMATTMTTGFESNQTDRVQPQWNGGPDAQCPLSGDDVSLLKSLLCQYLPNIHQIGFVLEDESDAVAKWITLHVLYAFYTECHSKHQQQRQQQQEQPALSEPQERANMISASSSSQPVPFSILFSLNMIASDYAELLQKVGLWEWAVYIYAHSPMDYDELSNNIRSILPRFIAPLPYDVILDDLENDHDDDDSIYGEISDDTNGSNHDKPSQHRQQNQSIPSSTDLRKFARIFASIGLNVPLMMEYYTKAIESSSYDIKSLLYIINSTFSLLVLPEITGYFAAHQQDDSHDIYRECIQRMQPWHSFAPLTLAGQQLISFDALEQAYLPFIPSSHHPSFNIDHDNDERDDMIGFDKTLDSSEPVPEPPTQLSTSLHGVAPTPEDVEISDPPEGNNTQDKNKKSTNTNHGIDYTISSSYLHEFLTKACSIPLSWITLARAEVCKEQRLPFLQCVLMLLAHIVQTIDMCDLNASSSTLTSHSHQQSSLDPPSSQTKTVSFYYNNFHGYDNELRFYHETIETSRQKQHQLPSLRGSSSPAMNSNSITGSNTLEILDGTPSSTITPQHNEAGSDAATILSLPHTQPLIYALDIFLQHYLPYLLANETYTHILNIFNIYFYDVLGDAIDNSFLFTLDITHTTDLFDFSSYIIDYLHLFPTSVAMAIQKSPHVFVGGVVMRFLQLSDEFTSFMDDNHDITPNIMTNNTTFMSSITPTPLTSTGAIYNLQNPPDQVDKKSLIVLYDTIEILLTDITIIKHYVPAFYSVGLLPLMGRLQQCQRAIQTQLSGRGDDSDKKQSLTALLPYVKTKQMR